MSLCLCVCVLFFNLWWLKVCEEWEGKMFLQQRQLFFQQNLHPYFLAATAFFLCILLIFAPCACGHQLLRVPVVMQNVCKFESDDFLSFFFFFCNLNKEILYLLRILCSFFRQNDMERKCNEWRWNTAKER
jgi:hypothetical protein